MPTEVDSISQRASATGSIRQLNITVMLASLIACLANLFLILLSPTLAAAVAAMGQL